MGNDYPEIEVSNMGAWTTTRSSSDVYMPVLHFKDEQTYNKTLLKVKEMDDTQKMAFFKELGFDGAYAIRARADKELDAIFDYDGTDSLYVAKLINDYKEKYSSNLAFNKFDTYDVTPYLTFTDENLALVGNASGYVVIGNSLKRPVNNSPTFDYDMNESIVYPSSDNVKSKSTRAGASPIEPGFKGFSNASLTIKNGKYKSTMTIGRIVNGNSFAIKFETKKKVLFWKKNASASYSLDLGLHSSIYNCKDRVICPNGASVSILNLRIETVGNVFNADVTNFTSSRGKAIGNQSYQGLRVI
jgi:hypothetical protein